MLTMRSLVEERILEYCNLITEDQADYIMQCLDYPYQSHSFFDDLPIAMGCANSEQVLMIYDLMLTPRDQWEL